MPAATTECGDGPDPPRIFGTSTTQPVFHKRDVILLGVYSHIINYFLYLPDYPIGQFDRTSG